MGSGCATYSDKTESMRELISAGQYEAGLAEVNRFIKVKDPVELPTKWKSETALAVLERATILHAMGSWDASATNFQAADEQLEFLDLRSSADEIGRYVFSDAATHYRTTPTEKLSLNGVNLINYLAQGDLDGAAIEAKRFTVMRNYLLDYDPEHAHGAFGSYLAGFVAERQGNPDSALRYYDEALQERELPTLIEPIGRLGQRGSYRSERLDRYLGGGGAGFPAPAKEAAPAEAASDDDEPAQDPAAPIPVADANPAAPNPAEVLVIIKTGRVPYKVPVRIPIGAAIGLAGAFVTGNTALLEHSAMKVVVFPDLQPAGNLFDSAEWTIDGYPVQLDLVSDLGAEINREFDELRPKIIGSAITRMIVRAAAAEGARAAGNQGNEVVGLLSALAIEGAMVALDKPDTRSWTTLPDRVWIGRTQVPPGEHTLEIVVRGSGGEERRTAQVNVGPGGYVVLDVTTLR
ncbi:TPR domain protein [Enhygromyxa salina]|uniref:TPR domain protein n=1 Tax=Enhygromyxa salina TaxID=215803 RepID=A0A0C2CWM0_9BACT|nr:TPR domain protein [Enhygromyxa salina]